MTTTVVYTYNGDGHRMAKAVDGVTTTYLVAVLGLSQVLVETTGGESIVYLYGHDLLAEEGGSGWTWHLGDGLGSVRQLADGNGIITLAQGYTPFGVLLWSAGSAATGYGFTGEQHNPSTGLYYLRARYYDPATGRFLTRDPFPGFAFDPISQHPYVYARNNPVNLVDPSGELAFIPLLLVAAAGGALGGLGYYGIQSYLNPDPCTGPQWDWGEAAFWGGVGLGMGVLLGTGIYGGWWLWTTFGPAATAVVSTGGGAASVPLTQAEKMMYWRQMRSVFLRAYPGSRNSSGQVGCQYIITSHCSGLIFSLEWIQSAFPISMQFPHMSTTQLLHLHGMPSHEPIRCLRQQT